MSGESRTCSQRQIQRLFGEGILASLSDAELVERFARERDPDIFAAIVRRHGPMVMAVCLGHIGVSGEVDDAFQATFLVLLERVGTFPVGRSLGGWLYRVARRVARQARRANARRRRRELAAGTRFEIGLGIRRRAIGDRHFDPPGSRSTPRTLPSPDRTLRPPRNDPRGGG